MRHHLIDRTTALSMNIYACCYKHMLYMTCVKLMDTALFVFVFLLTTWKVWCLRCCAKLFSDGFINIVSTLDNIIVSVLPVFVFDPLFIMISNHHKCFGKTGSVTNKLVGLSRQETDIFCGITKKTRSLQFALLFFSGSKQVQSVKSANLEEYEANI